MPAKPRKKKSDSSKMSSNSLKNYQISHGKGSGVSKRLLVKIAILFLLLIVGFLLFELLIENGFIENPFSDFVYNNEIQQFSVQDSCSVIAGQLIHTLLGEGECEVRCKQDCGLRDLSFYDYEFTERVGDCHVCDCYCR